MLLPNGEALGLDDLLEAFWKTVCQILAVGIGNFVPHLPDCHIKLRDCRSIFLSRTLLHDPPKVLYGGYVWGLARPILNKFHLTVIKPLFGGCWGVARGTILLQDFAASFGKTFSQILLQEFNMTLGVHGLPFRKNHQVAQTPSDFFIAVRIWVPTVHGIQKFWCRSALAVQ